MNTIDPANIVPILKVVSLWLTPLKNSLNYHILSTESFADVVSLGSL